MRRFRFLRDPDPAAIGDSFEAFLRWLEGPACLFISGADDSRCRAFVTLLHGNEPSGARALWRWLREGERPAVNLVCIVASVTAALTEPLFTHRMLPRARDLNRCFRPPFDDAQGRLAEEILELLRLHRPEAVVDMHNTSGSGPSFAVCTFPDRQHDALAIGLIDICLWDLAGKLYDAPVYELLGERRRYRSYQIQPPNCHRLPVPQLASAARRNSLWLA